MRRKAGHSGTFYPRFAQQIEQMVKDWLVDAPAPTVGKKALGLLVPHAGYIYSGKAAALAYHDLTEEHIDSFIIMHPSHHAAHFDFSLAPYDSFESPLGDVEMDEDLKEALLSLEPGAIHPSYHQKEHSMEIQLPLIKYFFPNAKICPLMLGRQIPENSLILANLLYEVLTRSHKRIVVVASTDLSHYHHATTAKKLDASLQEAWLALDVEGLWAKIQSGDCEACGIGGIMALMELAKLFCSAKPEIISYTHSGEVSGIDHQVVGYLAARLNL